MPRRPPERATSRTRGALAADGGIYLGNDVWIRTVPNAPSNTTDTGYGKGSILIDALSGDVWVNIGSASAPNWTRMQTAASG